jgi:hypothetical protein
VTQASKGVLDLYSPRSEGAVMTMVVRLAQWRTNRSNTSAAAALGPSILDETSGVGTMRKQVIAAAAAIVLGLATTATGTTAFARGGGGGGGGHGGGFGGGGHGFGGGGFGGRGFAMGHGGFGHGRFGHGRFEGRRFGRGLYAYGGDYDYGYCNPYYYPYGCYGY